MSADLKTKIHKLVDAIEDEKVLQMVAEDVLYYTENKDSIDELDEEQKKDLKHAIEEADDNNTIAWNDFKNELNEWKKKLL